MLPMIELDPKKRASAHELLQHPLIADIDIHEDMENFLNSLNLSSKTSNSSNTENELSSGCVIGKKRKSSL